MENSHSCTKVSRIRWADLSDSFSSTEGGTETGSVKFMPLLHPETALLKKALEALSVPITIYFNNLPYNLTQDTSILQFLQLSPQESSLVQIKIVENNGKFSGRAEVVVESRDLAFRIIDMHGHFLNERPVFMNLDGFYGRGQQFKKIMNLKTKKTKKTQPTKNKPRRRKNRTRRSPLKAKNDFIEDLTQYSRSKL